MTAIEKYRKLSADTSNYFECQDDVLSETEKAICFNVHRGHLPHETKRWIPKSQMQIVTLPETEHDKESKRYFIKVWLYHKMYN